MYSSIYRGIRQHKTSLTGKRSKSKDSRRSLGNDIFSDAPKAGIDIAEGLERYESLTDLSKRNVVISE